MARVLDRQNETRLRYSISLGVHHLVLGILAARVLVLVVHQMVDRIEDGVDVSVLVARVQDVSRLVSDFRRRQSGAAARRGHVAEGRKSGLSTRSRRGASWRDECTHPVLVRLQHVRIDQCTSGRARGRCCVWPGGGRRRCVRRGGSLVVEGNGCSL